MAGKGRPSQYKPEYDDQVRKLCLLGATDKDLAGFFDVNEDTIHEWKKVYPSFSESIKEGKQNADASVADRLYQRAMGFEHDSEEIKIVGGEIARVPVKKIYPPDTTAAIFWLKNRSKANWRDRIEQDITTNGESIKLSAEQSEQLLRARARRSTT